MQLNCSPNWRAIPGYAFGLPQSSMIASEDFPDNLKVLEVNETFSGLFAEILDGVDADTTIPANTQARFATARTIASATSMLQNWMGIAVSDDTFITAAYGSTKLNVVLPWWRLEASKKAYSLCVTLWNLLAQDQSVTDVSALRAEWHDQMSSFVSPAVNEYAQIKAILSLKINLTSLPGGILCLGSGERSRWMSSTTTDKTSSIGVSAARNKYQVALLLKQAALPAADHKIVHSADEAVAVARELSGAVVIKPADQDRGDGVAADLTTDVQIRNAFITARKFSSLVLVEKMISGFTHRLTVVNGQVISVRQRVPGGVTGDGKRAVAELIEEYNQSDFSRRWSRRRGRMPLELDSEVLDLLASSGLSLESILPSGQFLRLRRRDNINAGGRNIELSLDSGYIHPDNLQVAIDAAEVMRLDIAGIDLISADISKSWREVGAGICEVNARPQFAVRRTPELFEKVITGVTGHDPHVHADLIICTDNPSEREVVLHALNKKAVGWTIVMKEGVYRDCHHVMGPFDNGFSSAVAALTNRNTKAAICVMSISDLLVFGSPLRKWRQIHIHQNGMTDNEKSQLPALKICLGLRKPAKS